MMKMSDETPVSSLVLPVLIRPILSQLEKRNVSASQTLRSALFKTENTHPGFAYNLVAGIMKQGDISINMNESVLRLQGTVSDLEGGEYRLNRSEDAFQELNKKSMALKRILSRIPDEINDRKTFLETIKEIASAIKKLLDAVNEVSAYIPGPSNKQALEQRKREFVKYSKRFSNTLKDYFKEGHTVLHDVKILITKSESMSISFSHDINIESRKKYPGRTTSGNKFPDYNITHNHMQMVEQIFFKR